MSVPLQDIILSTLKGQGVHFFTGVPDSLLAPFLKKFQEDCHPSPITSHPIIHQLASNEGHAIALAMGWHLATQEIPVVYLQNSGLGNTLNPILSMASSEVMGIPMILLIGWRGELLDSTPPLQHPDEPQHQLQGAITLELLNLAQIHTEILSKDSNTLQQQIEKAFYIANQKQTPVALLVRHDLLTSPLEQPSPQNLPKHPISSESKGLSRKEIIQLILENLTPEAMIVGTTGYTSRELADLEHHSSHKPHHQSFYCVGAMGHALGVATGMAMAYPQKPVICLDGDGAFLMHTGSLMAAARCPNLWHILFNNQCHESVGGQKIPSESLNYVAIAQGFGYRAAYKVRNTETLLFHLQSLNQQFSPLNSPVNSSFTSPEPQHLDELSGGTFIEIPVDTRVLNSKEPLGRFCPHPANNKNDIHTFFRKNTFQN
ncbi:MAG: phosphonopyruvate decarboxylase [Cyanobacteria bacterium]|nr:phosphonopyruvate decarboxylase [Cyanobacteriota bacterium]